MKKTFHKKGAKQWGDQLAERPMMHTATCSQCHATCEVPFKPNGKKPIYCRDCFRKEGGGDARTSYSGSPRYNASRSNSSGSAGAYEKPAYRGSSGASAPRTGNDDVVKQLKELNAKMDKILDALMNLAE